MAYADTRRREMRRVMQVQLLLTMLMAGAFGFTHGLPGAGAALYGGAVTLLITGWLARKTGQAARMQSPGAGMAVIYSGTMLRYVLVVILVGVGIGVLHLSSLALLSTFAVTQFGFLAGLYSPKGEPGSGQ